MSELNRYNKIITLISIKKHSNVKIVCGSHAEMEKNISYQ